jgi:general stress protein CsbA
MDENNLTPEESISIISKAIANFKMNYKESAKMFLLGGWIFTLASFSNFIIIKVLQGKEAFELRGLLSLSNWILFASIAFVGLFLMERRSKKFKKVYSYLDGYIRNLWIVTAVSFFIGTLVCIKLEITPPPIMLLIAGIATTTTGLLIKFKPLIIGGMTFFLFSIAATFVQNEYIAILTGVAIICGYLIPGYYLKSAKE